jgi:hypothetical protein
MKVCFAARRAQISCSVPAVNYVTLACYFTAAAQIQASAEDQVTKIIEETTIQQVG